MKKSTKVTEEIPKQDFKFLNHDQKISDVENEPEKPDSVAMTQADFEKNSSCKKELREFMETQNIFLPAYSCTNNDY